MATGGPESGHPLGLASTLRNPPVSRVIQLLFSFCFVLSAGGSPRPRHSHPALPGALREHPHDHLAGHRLRLQGIANGTRGKDAKSYRELPAHVNLLCFPISSDCHSHFLRSLIAFE